MGSDELFKRRNNERIKREEARRTILPPTWLIVTEGTKTEPNYFSKAVEDFNKNVPVEYRLKLDPKGMGMNTKSLVKATDLQISIDKYNNRDIPYEKIFVVFDKDSFKPSDFDKAVEMCKNNGYIPLWSNQAIEFWFLLHFNYIDSKISRKDYAKKINEYFKAKGYDYNYEKNDKNIYDLLCKYGSVEKARKYAEKIYHIHENDKPSASESCTTVYEFFNALDDRKDELKNITHF